jgi:hypothetical protein
MRELKWDGPLFKRPSSMASTISDLQKLTVPQLKALCKERRITGYSKLGKAALLQKLIGLETSQSTSNALASTTNTSQVLGNVDPATKEIPVGTVEEANSLIKQSRGSQGLEQAVADPLLPLLETPSNVQASYPAFLDTTPLPSSNHAKFRVSEPVSIPNSVQSASLAKKRPAESLQHDHASAYASNKKMKKIPAKHNASQTTSKTVPATPKPTLSSTASATSMPPPTLQFRHRINFSSNMNFLTSSSTQLSYPMARPPTQKIPTFPFQGDSGLNQPLSNATLNSSLRTVGTEYSAKLPGGKRFKPLVLKSLPSPQEPVAITEPLLYASFRAVPTVHAPKSVVSLHHLDFPQNSIDALVLTPITWPPKLSMRKYVYRWSVILSGISNKERRQCVLVSRMFRYSGMSQNHSVRWFSDILTQFNRVLVYLSATRILEQKFNGRRLAHLTLKYPHTMINMWPYLLQRELEAKTRLHAYNQSFLAKYFQDFDPISERLRISPDNEKQIT